jgi:hypothetical protein
MNHSRIIVAALASACISSALAAVSADEAKQLGTTLTAVGAEKAANKEGTIPEYTGGLTVAPAGFNKGDGVRPDPYAGDKPTLSITAKNAEQYAGKLTEATKALLKKYPGYRVDVYPTHRSAAFPKYVTDNTVKNATRAKSVSGGLATEGAIGGFPFPIPKTGNEAMWNHLTRFNGQSYQLNYKNINVDSSGRPVLATAGLITQEYPYYDPAKTATDTYYKLKVQYTGPARRAGEALMVIDPLNPVEKGRRAWQYLPGQRRVKLAPDISYDTPNPGTGGATTYDDAFVFNGEMDRFDFKLVGKKEMYVPYNAYKLVYQSKADQAFTANHLNPDLLRWELHRVWVVEATLKPGARHIYSKRVFYLDEDSWVAVASDEYDGRNQLYRSLFMMVTPSYDIPAPFADVQLFYDLVAGIYGMSGYVAETGGVKYTAPLKDSEWSADALAGSGIR